MSSNRSQPYYSTLQVNTSVKTNLVRDEVLTDRSIVVWFNDDYAPEVIAVDFLDSEAETEFLGFFSNKKPVDLYQDLVLNQEIINQCHLVKIPQYALVHKTKGYANFVPDHSYYTI